MHTFVAALSVIRKRDLSLLVLANKHKLPLKSLSLLPTERVIGRNMSNTGIQSVVY